MKLQNYESLGEMIRDPKVIWYGPHKCSGCETIIVKSSNETGGIALDAPQEHHYPNYQWRLHQCPTRLHQYPSDECNSAKPVVDLSVGKIIRIKSRKPHAHSIWKITAHMDGATQQENLVEIQRLELNPGNNVDGKVQQRSIVPMALLSTHPAIENC